MSYYHTKWSSYNNTMYTNQSSCDVNVTTENDLMFESNPNIFTTILSIVTLGLMQLFWIFQTQQFANTGYHKIAWMFGPLLPLFLLLWLCAKENSEKNK